jgi:hypothetical protein
MTDPTAEALEPYRRYLEVLARVHLDICEPTVHRLVRRVVFPPL